MKLTILLVAIIAAATTIVTAAPCDVTLATIKASMASANTFRQQCEKSYFSDGSCNSYWAKVNEILNLQIDYQDCGRLTQNQFYADVRSSIATEANNTRTSITTNAATTQTVVTNQNSQTRAWTTTESNRVISEINTKVSAEATTTRTTVSNEAASTRTLVSAEASSTRTTVSNEAANTRSLISTSYNSNTASLSNLQATQSNFTTLFVSLLIQMDFSGGSGRVDLFQRPNSRGGYFDTVRAVVRDIIDNNVALYGSNKVGYANTYFNNGESYRAAGDYRRAWEKYRDAYAQATASQ